MRYTPVTINVWNLADHGDRELEEDAVPEWRAKYLDYKVRTMRRLGDNGGLTIGTGRQEEAESSRARTP